MHQSENECNTLGNNGDQNSSNHCKDGSSCDSKNNVPPKPNFGRYCHIVKRPDFDGYGFNLHSEKVKPGQYIGKVDANSPAEAAGLREGDQIIEVNGVNIGSETHKQVVQRIKAISNEVRLLLIDLNADGHTRIATKNPETNTVSGNRTSYVNSSKLPTTMSATQPNLPRIVPGTEVETSEVTDAPAYEMEFVTSATMLTHSQSNFTTNTRLEATELDAGSTNGHPRKLNSQSMVPLTTGSPVLPTTSAEKNKSTELQQNVNLLQNNGTTNKTGLNLNLTAAEMRAKLLSKKKFDPKNESVDLKKKFDIIQKL